MSAMTKHKSSTEVMGFPLGHSSRESFLLTWSVRGTVKHAEAVITTARGRSKKEGGGRLGTLSCNFPSLSLLQP